MAIKNPCGDQVYSRQLHINDFSYSELKSLVKWLKAQNIMVKIDSETDYFCIVFDNRESYVEFQLVWNNLL